MNSLIPKEYRGMAICIVAHGNGLVYANAYDKAGNWRGAWRISKEEARLMCLRGQAAKD